MSIKNPLSLQSNILTSIGRNLTLTVVSIFLLTGHSACDTGSGSENANDQGMKAIQIKIKDIRSKTITYDIYQVSDDELEYVGTEIADRDGSTEINVEVNSSVNNIIIKRTKDGVEKRQVVPLKSDKVEVQFLL